METDVLKPFINRTVEVLVAGVWIEGHMTPIVKGVVTLLPIGANKEFYGPTALKAEVIQAIRQVKATNVTPDVQVPDANNPNGTVRSSLEQTLPAQRFVRK